MDEYTNVSRKDTKEDRVAICPEHGCEYMTCVKPLKFMFFNFGNHPKCKKHNEKILKKVKEVNQNVRKSYSIIKNSDLIKDPLKKSHQITENIEVYLKAKAKLSRDRKNATSEILSEYLELNPTTVLNFFRFNKYIKLFINVERDTYYKFTLNERGKEVFSFFNHLRETIKYKMIYKVIF